MPTFVVLVPAYEPAGGFPLLVREVLKAAEAHKGFRGLIVVDDGSATAAAKAAFDAIRDAFPTVTLLSHAVNRGKGAALKTGFTHILEHDLADHVITADADGQHAVDDIFRIAERAVDDGRPGIGYRQFTGDVPSRSRFGNILTALLFRIATGHKIVDTQSGLRSYPKADLARLCRLAADHYEFEFQCLFDLAKHSERGLVQLPIKTIYEPHNPTSHFNPIWDSMRIYATFFRYVSVSALSGLIDIAAFSILSFFGVSTLTGLVLARLISAPLYFYGMRNIVFKSSGNLFLQAAATAALMAFHVTFLWQFIDWLSAQYPVPRSVSMIIGVLTFYIGNFLVQRFVIYPVKTGK